MFSISRIIRILKFIYLSGYHRIKAIRKGSWISLCAKLVIEPGATFAVGRDVRVMSGSHIHISKNGTLILENGSWVGPYNIIYCNKSIIVGKNTRISHFCTIVDHNYKFHKTNFYFELPKTSAPIYIGENSWLGASSILLKNVRLGTNCIIGAGTLLKSCELPDNTICARPSDYHLNSINIIKSPND